MPDAADYWESTASYWKIEIARLQLRVEELKAMLGKARSDIWQTARVNQGNIDGVDLVTPGDRPCKEWIGNHFVHQRGVWGSLRIVSEIDTFLHKESDMKEWDTEIGPGKILREVSDHKIGGFNDGLKILVMDLPGPGGANHHYDVYRAEPKPVQGTLVGSVKFQHGPIAENGLNGISNEVLLAIVADRLRGFQSGDFACDENQDALDYISNALDALKSRTQARVERGVEGTSEK